MCADNPVRVVDVFVDERDLSVLSFTGVGPAATVRLGDHPATLLNLYPYGYLNQIAFSRHLEREAGRKVGLMWLTGRLAPDFKAIADFRRNNGPATQAACTQFVVLCRHLGLLTGGVVALDGSRFKAGHTRDKTLTPGAIQRCIEQVEAGTRFRRLVKDHARCPSTLADPHLVAFVCLMLRQAAQLATSS